MARPRRDARDRFIEKVQFGSDDECWPWLGYRIEHGYGKFRDEQSRLVFAHRFAYELWKEPIAEGLVVMHTCDYPPCVNPAHLIAGTQMQNITDREQKGRGGNRGRPRLHL